MDHVNSKLCSSLTPPPTLQATSYIVAAWEALAAKLKKPMAEVACQWEDIHMHNAVITGVCVSVLGRGTQSSELRRGGLLSSLVQVAGGVAGGLAWTA